MSEVIDTTKWWAKALFVSAIVGLATLPIGALGSKFGIWPFTLGFMLLAVGVVLATIAFFVGIIAAVYANSKKLNEERKKCLIGVAISIVVLGLMGNQFLSASDVPSIHNITTDTENPPQFETLMAVREAEGANSVEYDAEKLGPLQRQAYPYVQSLVTRSAQSVVFDRTVAALTDLGMEVVAQNPNRGHIEATDTTFWFGFKDEVVVRISAEGVGSVVDIRSVSRVGQSDLGKNAQRIGQILNHLADL